MEAMKTPYYYIEDIHIYTTKTPFLSITTCILENPYSDENRKSIAQRTVFAQYA